MRARFFLLILILPIAATSQNLIKNGSFDVNTDYWRGSVTLSPYDKKAGNASGFIEQFVGQQWKGIDQVGRVPENVGAIEFSAWLRSDGIRIGKEDYNAGVFIVDFLTVSDKKISTQNIATVSGNKRWEFYKKTCVLPPDTAKIRVMLALAQTTGVFFFDEIKAMPVSKEAYDKSNQAGELPAVATPESLANGDFEKGLEGWAGNGSVVAAGKDGSPCLRLSSEGSEWIAAYQGRSIPQGATSISLSAWLKAIDIRQGKQSWNNGMFIVEFTSDGISKTSEDQLIGTVTGTTDWTLFEKNFSIPKGSTRFRIMIALSECPGQLLADNVKVAFAE